MDGNLERSQEEELAGKAEPQARAHEAGEASHESEGKFRAVFNSDVVPLQIARIDGKITDANDAFLRLVGCSRDELESGRIWFTNLTPPEWRQHDQQLIDELVATGRFGPLEKEYQHRDGHRIPVLIGGSALPGHDDYGVAFTLDLTEQKRAQAALKEQLLLTKTITDNASAALFLMEGGGACTFANPAAEAMFGFALDELRQRPLCDIIHGWAEGRPHPTSGCLFTRAALQGGPVRSWEDILVRKSGEVFPATCVASSILRDGQPAMAVIEVRDITERRRIEHGERLLESERAARAAAERANRIKDEFLATISHELLTPLNAILGWAQIVQRPGAKPEQITKALSVIERNARLQAQLVSDLLDVSRILSGKIHLKLAPVDLSDAIETALDQTRGSADEKGVMVSVSLAHEGALVFGDPSRLPQIIWNLISNAVKFTPAGGRVDVELSRAEAGIALSVSDTGIGIAPEFLPHVFERFRQADASATRQFGGLGLGLSIVKRLVELHRGCVRAESEGLGKGARFVVELPIMLATGARLSTGDAESAEWWEAGALSSTNVLVVDDETDARDLLVRILEEAGASVVAMPSALRALEVLGAEHPDVIVSDIGMPGMDGYELIRRIRAGCAPKEREVPALALTAFARDEDRAHALAAGFQAHLAKPIDPSEVVEVIATLLSRRGPRASRP
jgi:PAS domain S-box-containing protein